MAIDIAKGIAQQVVSSGLQKVAGNLPGLLGINKGKVKFSDDGKSIVGTGKATFTLSWNDNPRTAGTALGTIEIMDKKWTQSGRSGSKTQTVTISAPNDGGSYESHIKLRNKE